MAATKHIIKTSECFYEAFLGEREREREHKREREREREREENTLSES
jgi:hypothetical protein